MDRRSAPRPPFFDRRLLAGEVTLTKSGNQKDSKQSFFHFVPHNGKVEQTLRRRLASEPIANQNLAGRRNRLKNFRLRSDWSYNPIKAGTPVSPVHRY